MHRVGEKRKYEYDSTSLPFLTPPLKKKCVRRAEERSSTIKRFLQGVVQYVSHGFRTMFSPSPAPSPTLPPSPPPALPPPGSYQSIDLTPSVVTPTTHRFWTMFSPPPPPPVSFQSIASTSSVVTPISMLSEKPVTSTPRADDSPYLSNSGNGDFNTSSAEERQKNGHSHQVNKPEFFLRKRSSFNSSLLTTRPPEVTQDLSNTNSGSFSVFSVTPETATGRHNDVNNRGCSVPEVTDSYCSPKPKSEVDDTKQGLSVQTPTLLEDQTSYWTRWMKDFKKNYKHLQNEKEAVMEVARTKLQFYQQKRMKVDDKKVAKLRNGLFHTHLYSDDEDDNETTWALSSQQMERVTTAIRRGSGEECLSERYRIRITRDDLRTLTGSVWLNDEVINFYFNLIGEYCKKENDLKVHVFNSFFYPKLSQFGYSGVRRWTKKVDLFDHDLILLPIHLGVHWCLAAIDFKSCNFIYYDSLQGTNLVCLNRLREYLKCEFQDKRPRKGPFDLSGWSNQFPDDIPQQTNSSDCGVFTCMYASHKARRVEFNFCQNDMADIRNRMIYEILEQTLV